MLDKNFVILGALLNVLGGISYLKETLKGNVKPNKVSWLLWALAPLIAFAAQINQGVGLESLMTFSVGFIPLCIFIASFVNKNSEWKLSKLDIACCVLSVLGLVLWFITRVGNVAILFSIGADALASIPTIVKSYHAPETEDYKIYLISAISAILTLLTIKDWNIATAGFPTYIFLVGIIIFVLIRFKLGRELQKIS